VGISTVATLLARRSQVHQFMMVQNMSPTSFVYRDQLTGLAQYLQTHAGGGGPDATLRALQLLYGTLLKQSALWAFVDIFEWKILVCGVCILLVLFPRNVKRSDRVPTY